MRSKNSKAITKKESDHLFRVKSLDCACCGAKGPCDAHHIKQGKHFITIPLCKDCHVNKLGIHGDKTMLRIMKIDELDMLNDTIEKLYGDR